MSSKDFWDYTDDEIRRGMDLIYDSALRDQNQMDPMIGFVYDVSLQKRAEWLMDCEWDRNLMRIKYADELQEFTTSLSVRHIRLPWFTAGKSESITQAAIAILEEVKERVVLP